MEGEWAERVPYPLYLAAVVVCRKVVSSAICPPGPGFDLYGRKALNIPDTPLQASGKESIQHFCNTHKLYPAITPRNYSF